MKTEKHPKLANGQPAISCFGLAWAELKRRNHLAHERAAKALPKSLSERELLESYAEVARGILWHTDFADGLKLLVCDTELFEVAARLQMDLEAANDKQSLDFYDYVADLLRELLAGYDLLKGDYLCLKRALAWVEEKGSGLRDYALEA